MKCKGWLSRLVLLIPALGAIPSTCPAAEHHSADVVIYGATAGGVVAAVAASREGRSVVIVEPAGHVGGMVSGGLGATDYGNRSAIGGISREFFRRVLRFYVETYGPSSPQVKDCQDGFKFEPHVAEAVFRKMLEEAKVEVVYESPIAKVFMTGVRISTLTSVRGDVFAGSVFIDASYEGDLLALAKVASTYGRESEREYGESIAGVQARSPAHQWSIPVPARAPDGKPLPTVDIGPIGRAGDGDRKIQAYTYRLCMTDRKDNQVPFPRPANYDADRYELLARYLALKPKLKVGQLMHPSRLPNGKTDTNNNGPFSTDHIGGNWGYPEADPAGREKIRVDHVAYVQGFFYFLANDPRVPRALHDEMAGWGLAKDEFVDTDHWPHQLYVREARRMLGSYIMTQADITEDRTKVDSVGLGSYATDSHHVQRVAQADGSALNEGDFQVPVRPYAIPYRSLVPRPSECSNLLVPVCMSASHVAYGTIRMEPVYMILGHACGVAASLAIDDKVPVQAILAERLTAKLLEQGSVLDPAKLPSPPGSVGLDPAKMEGVVVDDREAIKTGEWAYSSAIGPFVGEGYLHDGGKGDGSASVVFRPKLPKAGRYEVRLYSTPNPNRATNVTVRVGSTEGEKRIKIDQRRPNDGKPVVIGIFSFEPGESSWVAIGNGGADGHVIADAVQFAPMP